MTVTCTGEGRVLRAALTGEVDHHGAKTVMEELCRHIDNALPRTLCLDMAGVSFMDSSGIAVLLRAHRRMGELGGTLTVVGVPAQAAKVLQAAGVQRIIPFEIG